MPSSGVRTKTWKPPWRLAWDKSLDTWSGTMFKCWTRQRHFSCAHLDCRLCIQRLRRVTLIKRISSDSVLDALHDGHLPLHLGLRERRAVVEDRHLTDPRPHTHTGNDDEFGIHSQREGLLVERKRRLRCCAKPSSRRRPVRDAPAVLGGSECDQTTILPLQRPIV